MKKGSLTPKRSYVIKSSGIHEPFSASKFKRSLARTGLKPRDCKQISDAVCVRIRPGIKTKDIYNRALRLVRKHSTVAATRYSLKRALFDLGPAGFVFERFVSRYFEAIGFKTYVGVILQGEFVRHEVDVIASKNNYQIYVECKFHNSFSKKNDIKTALYVKARWDDLKRGPDGKYLRGYYLATNTTFTKDAIVYSEGSGLKLLGVNAPEKESFLDQIERYNLYPITSLKRLKKSYVQELLMKNILLCTDLLNEKSQLSRMGLTADEIKNIFSDIEKIIKKAG